jgi:hypothetical protein
MAGWCCLGLVYTFDCSRLVNWWATTLYLAILRPLRNLLLHRESMCGQVSLSFIWHNVEFGLAIRDFFYDCPCIGRIGTEELCDLSVYSLWGFPKVVRQW